jgi:glycine/D-amino acid oxidase-like deaminating enzyme
MAWSQPDDPVGFDFAPAGRQQFVDRLWPELIAHLPAFDALRVASSWAGLYAVNRLDGNAIIGKWPGKERMVFATGFSGHGFQHFPAMGRYLAELILDTPHVIDLSRLGPQRIIDGAPIHENRGRLV